MSTPTIIEPTGTATDGTNQKWGGPNAKHAAQLLKGNHPTEKIQVSAIAGAVSLTGVETVTNKTMRAANNTLPDVFILPDAGKGRVGGWIGGATSGFGQYNGLTSGTPTGGANTQNNVPDATNGKSLTCSTGTTANNNAGLRYGSGAATIPALEPYMKAKFQLTGTVTNLRVFIGFQNASASFATGDDPFNGVNGVCFGARAADTTFQISRGAASGATTFVNTTVPINNTNIRTFEIKAVSGGTEWQWAIDGGSFTSITTTIPATNAVMYPVVAIETSNTTGKVMELYWFTVWTKA